MACNLSSIQTGNSGPPLLELVGVPAVELPKNRHLSPILCISSHILRQQEIASCTAFTRVVTWVYETLELQILREEKTHGPIFTFKSGYTQFLVKNTAFSGAWPDICTSIRCFFFLTFGALLSLLCSSKCSML